MTIRTRFAEAELIRELALRGEHMVYDVGGVFRRTFDNTRRCPITEKHSEVTTGCRDIEPCAVNLGTGDQHTLIHA